MSMMDDTGTDSGAQLAFDALYRPFSGSDLLTARAAPPPMLLSDFLRSRSITLISGEPFSGKTLLTLSICLSIDTLHPLFDLYTPSPGHRCLFIGQDAPTWDYFAQVAALTRGFLRNGAPIHLPSIYILNKGLSLFPPQQFIDFIAQAIAIYDIDVLCLDVFKSFHDFDENSNADMSRVMTLLKYLRDNFALSILLTHHTSKAPPGIDPLSMLGNYRARGASVIAGSIDQHFLLTTRGSVTHIAMPKARGGATPLSISNFSIARGNSPAGPTLSLVASSQVASIPSLIPLLLRDQPLSIRELFSQLRADVRFSQLSDAQLYSRLASSLRTLARRGEAQSLRHGLWGGAGAADQLIPD